MSFDSTTERLISLKKLAGKAHTSNDKGLSNEALPTGITQSSNTIFGETISNNPANDSLYAITDGNVEFVRLQVVYIPGSNTTAGKHGFELKLPADYQVDSSNPKKGTAPFVNGQSIQSTRGAIQIIPPSYGDKYEAKPFYGGDAAKGSGTSIPLLDARDWYLDYFNGVFFQQDPPSSSSDTNNPTYIEAFIYIGKMLNEVVEDAANSGGSGGTGTGGNNYLTSPAADYLLATGSISFSPISELTSDIGSDTFFFVSGSIGGKESGEGVAVFGGDLVVSGNLSINGSSINLNQSSLNSDELIIRHQYALEEYTGNFLSIDSLGDLNKRSYQSSVLAKSQGSNSDLYYFCRFPLFRKASVYNVLNNVRDTSGNQTVITVNSTVNNGYSFLHDYSLYPTTINRNVFDAVNTSLDTSGTYARGNMSADVSSDLNWGLYILSLDKATELNSNDLSKASGLSYTYTSAATSSTQISFTFTGGSANIEIYRPDELEDATRRIFNDINGSPGYTTYLASVSKTLDSKISNRWSTLFDYYVSINRYDLIKIGTKVSINRYEELKDVYESLDFKTSILENTIRYNGSLQLSSVETTLFGNLRSLKEALDSGISQWNTTNSSNQIPLLTNTNYSDWDETNFNNIINSNSTSKFVLFRFFLIPACLKMYETLYEIYNSIVSSKSTFANLSIDKSAITTLCAAWASGTKTLSAIFNPTNGAKLPGRNATDKYNDLIYKVRNYDEYTYYRTLHTAGTVDLSQRDYIQTFNRGQTDSAATYISVTETETAGSGFAGTEELIQNRYTLMLASEPSLLVDGAAVFLGPVSLSKLYGQSPIQVNTTLSFGEQTVALDENGDPILDDDGNVQLVNTNQLSLNSKGFVGDLQVTGSINITGFDRTDGMHINMGNLVMKTDLDGYNMPMFNMINNNSNPLERPQILLSNNLSSFASGEKAYHMGEITFGGPRNDSPSDDKENISISGVINENDGIGVNYLSMDFYINEERNLTGSDGLVPEDNKKRRVFVLGQFGDDNSNNQFGVSTGMGIRGNILPLAVTDYSDLGNNIPAHHNTLGNNRYRWGGLFLDEDRQIEFGAPLSTHATIGYNSSNYSLEVGGRTRFLNGLTGSLTKLTDGTSFIRGSNGITVTTGSKGEINLELTENISTGVNTNSIDKFVATSLTGNSIFVESGILELGNYNDDVLNIYNNGLLLISGSYQNTIDGVTDYYVNEETNEITFSFNFKEEDILSIVCHNDITDDRGQYRYDRIFSAKQAAGTNVWFNFDFNTINNDYEKFDVYLNGQYIQRLEGVDESNQTYTIAAYNRLRFDFDIEAKDIITLIFKIPNPNSLASGGTESNQVQTKSKYVYELTQDYASNSSVTISGSPFELDAYNKDILTVYHNGKLMISGSENDVSRGLADYVVIDTDKIKFSAELYQDDIFTFDLVLPGYDYYYNETVFLTANNSLLNNTLKITGSSDIDTEIVNSTLVIKHKKELVFNEVVFGEADGVNQNFSLFYQPFSSNEISIFVNGMLQSPVNSFDYHVENQNIIFSPGAIPPSGSLVMAIYNKVV